MLLREPIAVNAGQRIEGTLTMLANERYSYQLHVDLTLVGSAATTADGRPVQSVIGVNLADQQYNLSSG